MDDDVPPYILRITWPSVRFPVLMDGGFGQVTVTLEPGQQETITVNGRSITVIRDYLQ